MRVIKNNHAKLSGIHKNRRRINRFLPNNGRIKQGDGLTPPMLFNLALEYVIRKIRIDMGSTIMNKSMQLAGYADDVDILGRSICLIKEAFFNLEESG